MRKAPKKIRPSGIGGAPRSMKPSLCTEILRSGPWIIPAGRRLLGILPSEPVVWNRSRSANAQTHLRIEVSATQSVRRMRLELPDSPHEILVCFGCPRGDNCNWARPNVQNKFGIDATADGNGAAADACPKASAIRIVSEGIG